MQTQYFFLQLGTLVFAITGVLGAARQNMDVLSFIIIGVVTALGGGTLRDVMLDVPPFWLRDATYVYVAAGAAIATFFFERRFRATERAFLYLDALATALFTVLAIDKTLSLDFSPTIAVIMGTITGIAGGLIRDLLTGQPTIIMRRELYMTPILLGGTAYVFLRAIEELPGIRAAAIAIAAITLVRCAAIRFSWAFPRWLTYKPLT